MNKLLKTKLALLIIISLMTTPLLSQDISLGNKYFDLGDYDSAIEAYQTYINSNPSDHEALYKIAESYAMTRDYARAAAHYKAALDAGALIDDTLLKYALTLMRLERYTDAKISLGKFATVKPDIAKQYIRACDYALAIEGPNPVYEVSGEWINTSAADYAPAIFGDAVVYSSSRKDLNKANVIENKDGKEVNYLLTSTRDENDFLKIPKYLRSSIQGNNNSQVSYAEDAKLVAFVKNTNVEGTNNLQQPENTNIYFAKIDAKGNWDNEVPFPYAAATFSNAYPHLSADGRVLYFSSNKADGYGGYDIYVSYFNDNKWSLPQSLGEPINTVGNEICPFVVGDNIYFASDYHVGLGGYDIFRANEEKKIYNPGLGINSPLDDYGFVYDSKNEVGYLVSDRKGGKGNEDIYRVLINKVQPNNNVINIAVLSATDRKPVKGAYLDFSECGYQGLIKTDENGKFDLAITQNLNCVATISKAGFLTQTVVFDKNTPTGLLEILLAKENEGYPGLVLDAETNTPIEGLLVRATNQKTGQKYETLSDEEGRFSLPLISRTKYFIKLSKAGYIEANTIIVTAENATKNAIGTWKIPPVGSSASLSNVNTIDELPSDFIETPPSDSEKDNIIVETRKEKGFSIQIMALSARKDVKEVKINKMRGIDNLYFTDDNTYKRIRIGTFASKEEASQFLSQVKANGYPKAYIVEEDGSMEMIPINL